jgi:hypothetical protein
MVSLQVVNGIGMVKYITAGFNGIAGSGGKAIRMIGKGEASATVFARHGLRLTADASFPVDAE